MNEIKINNKVLDIFDDEKLQQCKLLSGVIVFSKCGNYCMVNDDQGNIIKAYNR